MSRTALVDPILEATTGTRESSPSGAWLSELQHALRTPIATIQNYCELMLACPPEDELERREFVRTIAQEAEHLNKIVADLVELERANQAPASNEPCDLRDAVQRAALSLHPFAVERNVEVEVEDRTDGIAVVLASPARIERAITALVENAIRFSPPGAKVDVNLLRLESAWRIEVHDRGPGVAAEHRERVFEKFFRAVEPPDGGKFKSSGLGLTVARAIAEQAGGSVTWELGPSGATFVLRLAARG